MSMPSPELYVEAWSACQNAFHAQRACEEPPQQADAPEPEEAEPREEYAAEAAPRQEDFWQDWFGVWR